MKIRTLCLAAIVLAAFFMLASTFRAWPRDDGRWAQSPLKQWFDNLRSERGTCCSNADGMRLDDVDWEMADGTYRVRIDGRWFDVPDDAVINEPNRYGPAVVWPYRGPAGHLLIRCFLRGAQS